MNGIGVNDAGSGIAIRSGSLGSWPIAPTAYPANPTPSVASMSTASTGTSLAQGFPRRSTNSARMNFVSDCVHNSASVARSSGISTTLCLLL